MEVRSWVLKAGSFLFNFRGRSNVRIGARMVRFRVSYYSVCLFVGLSVNDLALKRIIPVQR